MKHLFSINNGWLCQNNGIQKISAATRHGGNVKMKILWIYTNIQRLETQSNYLIALQYLPF